MRKTKTKATETNKHKQHNKQITGKNKTNKKNRNKQTQHNNKGN